MRKQPANKNSAPSLKNIKNLLEEYIYIVYSNSNGKEWKEFPKGNIPELIFCDSDTSSLIKNKLNKETESQKGIRIVPFLYLNTNIKIKNKSIGFVLSADDYIMKPITGSQLVKFIKNNIDNEAIDITGIAKSAGKIDSRLQLRKYTEDDRIFIESRRNPKIIKIGDITFITSKINDSIIHLADHSNLSIRKTLSSWEEFLPGNTFKRINRSTIINLKYVDSIARWNRETYIIRLMNVRDSFTVSQRYARAMRTEFK